MLELPHYSRRYDMLTPLCSTITKPSEAVCVQDAVSEWPGPSRGSGICCNLRRRELDDRYETRAPARAVRGHRNGTHAEGTVVSKIPPGIEPARRPHPAHDG
jgi:hypothetical protein